MAASALSAHAAFDPELHYGDGDDNALYNLFATWPENYFSSLPKPHGNRGIDEPYWELRQPRIFLDDWFRGRGARRLSTPAVPGPDKLERARLRERANSDDDGRHIRSTVCFRSALDFAQEQAKIDNTLARELAQYCTTITARHAAPSARGPSSSSVLPTSPSPRPASRDQGEYEEWNGLSDAESTSQDTSIPILNPPIPGPAAVSVDALQLHVNEFAKQNGFGVIRRNGSGSQARKTRYVFQCGTASLVCQEAQVSAKGDRASVVVSGRSLRRLWNGMTTCGLCARLPTLSTANITTTAA